MTRKTATTKRMKALLVLAPMVLALSAFGAHRSYADDYAACPSPYYAYPTWPYNTYPYCGYVYGDGFWWGGDFDDHRDFHHHDFDRNSHQ